MPKRDARQVEANKPHTDLWIYLVLAAAVFATYSQVLRFDFINYDDPDYVTENPRVRAGLTIAGAAWAFTSSFAGNWFPLTWLSHMLDAQLFGIDSGWHHFTNVVIHALSTLLLFAVLERITKRRWLSAAVAFLFALHPLHVESVAWVAERKDVLSALFWILTLWCYARYIERATGMRYAVTVAAFCLGLMAKPTLVTLPLVLVLLDWWPLSRGLRLVEKLPFLALSAVVCMVTYFVHRSAGAVASFDFVPLAVRFENALISYCMYVVKMFWPTGLAVFYPYPQHSLAVPAICAGLALLSISAIVVVAVRRRPYLAVGWLWYLVTLAPMIGLVQVGAQSRADRYTYIPMIGLSIAVVWALEEVLRPRPRLRTAVAAAAFAGCIVLTTIQLRYWQNGVILFRHAIAVTRDNYVARFDLATLLSEQGEDEEAIIQLRDVVRIQPRFATAHSELGQLLAKRGQADDAFRELQLGIRLNPQDADLHYRLASVLGAAGRPDEAEEEFIKSIRLRPNYADAHYNLGIALASQQKIQEAVREFQLAVRLKPEDADAHFNLGIGLASTGQIDEAIAQFSDAIHIRPDLDEARKALEQALSMRRPSSK